MNRTVRLTTGQALTRFLARQFVERDGRQSRFIEGIWGIFGHGNVAGFGQGIVELAREEGLPFIDLRMNRRWSTYRLHLPNIETG